MYLQISPIDNKASYLDVDAVYDAEGLGNNQSTYGGTRVVVFEVDADNGNAGSYYNRATGEFYTSASMPTTEEKLFAEIEKLKTDNLITQEAIATIYEDSKQRGLQADEVLATIYEEVSTIKGGTA